MEKKYIQVYFKNNPQYKFFVDCTYHYEFNAAGVPIFLHVQKPSSTGEDETHTFPIGNIERVVERQMRAQ